MVVKAWQLKLWTRSEAKLTECKLLAHLDRSLQQCNDIIKTLDIPKNNKNTTWIKAMKIWRIRLYTVYFVDITNTKSISFNYNLALWALGLNIIFLKLKVELMYSNKHFLFSCFQFFSLSFWFYASQGIQRNNNIKLELIILFDVNMIVLMLLFAIENCSQ